MENAVNSNEVEKPVEDFDFTTATAEQRRNRLIKMMAESLSGTTDYEDEVYLGQEIDWLRFRLGDGDLDRDFLAALADYALDFLPKDEIVAETRQIISQRAK